MGTHKKNKIQEQAKDQEIKAVYEVQLLKDDIQVNPDGTLKVKIPVVKGIKNPKLVLQQKDGSYIIVDAKEEDGYYVYEADFLGNVSVIGDKDERENSQEEPKEDPSSPDEKLPINKPPVQGNYVSNGGVGGASTGDETNVLFYVIVLMTSSRFLYVFLSKRKAK